MAFQFLNADLEILSEHPLEELRNALMKPGTHFSELYCGDFGAEGYLASFEVSLEYGAEWQRDGTNREPTAQDRVEAFCAVVSKLSGALRQLWDQATSRAIDVGYQSDDHCNQLRDSLKAATLARMAELNIDLVLTVYPMTIKNGDGSIASMLKSSEDECGPEDKRK